ncbi:MAG: hypothetical protein QF464_13925 [Myxococcota bacterium]|jgi:hypothetical protein|nr:hypothetical protein [Myxococcota bacterium]
MTRDVWTRSELFEGLDPAPVFVAELERLGLLVVVGQDGQGGPLYAPEARAELEKVLDLVDLGYQPEDIAVISKRVGLPTGRRGRFARPPVHLSGPEVASRAGVDVDRFEAWVAAGLLRPSLRPDSDETLYLSSTVARVERLRDLAIVGVDADALPAWCEALDWLDTRRPSGEMSAKEAARVDATLTELLERLGAMSDTVRRWRRLTATFKRRLDKLRPSSGGKRTQGKRRMRTRTRS